MRHKGYVSAMSGGVVSPDDVRVTRLGESRARITVGEAIDVSVTLEILQALTCAAADVLDVWFNERESGK